MAFFTFEDRQVYYETYGEGKPLLILNGIMMSHLSWKEFIEPFSANNQLILVDFFDQGFSAKMDGPYNHDIQIRLVLALLDYLKIEQACVAGISYGSEVALGFAINHPERVERLMLFNCSAATGYWLDDIGKSWNLAAENAEAYYYTSIPIIYSPKFYKNRHDWMEKRREILFQVFSNKDFINSMIRLTNSSSDYDVRERLGEVQCPTLIVSCKFDYLTPMEEQEYLAQHIKDSHYIILPESGHATMYEQPVLFASLILGFTNNTRTAFGDF